jgi:hypothetical protein
LGHRLLETEVGIGDDQADTAQPAADELAQELKPELMVLGRTDVDAHHLTLAGGANTNRNQDRHRDHPAVLPDLLESGIQEEVWKLAVQTSRAEGVDLGVELLADTTDLVFGDALDAERLGQVVDRSCRDAVDVCLLDDREQRPLVPATWLEKAREVSALAELGDMQLQGADMGVRFPVSKVIAGVRPARRPVIGPRWCASAPTRSVTSASISSCASSCTPSRRKFGSAPCSDLLSRSNSVILRLAIVVVLLVVV